ncbi:hypothetical protein AJ87_30175 [Rhizobium yanglingense]|nr:hypothetical protein AJ87_30175 [Rhizobium yanglingense]
MKAYTAGFLEDIPAAIATMKQAEARYPNDSTLPALRAQLAMLINDRIQMKEAIDRSLSIDPTDPNALQARARMRADYEGNLDGALEDLNNAIKVAPGSSTAWNDLGLLQDARGATREAEAALKKSIELDPDDPVGHANLAILYLDQSRMNEAKREIDLALAADPAFNIAILARGRYYLQMGEREKAVDDLLASSTANPGYSQAQLMLAAGHYENGNREASSQALDNADRLDENDPSVAAFRAAVAIDDYDSDGAMKSAVNTSSDRARGADITPRLEPIKTAARRSMQLSASKVWTPGANITGMRSSIRFRAVAISTSFSWKREPARQFISLWRERGHQRRKRVILFILHSRIIVRSPYAFRSFAVGKSRAHALPGRLDWRRNNADARKCGIVG